MRLSNLKNRNILAVLTGLGLISLLFQNCEGMSAQDQQALSSISKSASNSRTTASADVPSLNSPEDSPFATGSSSSSLGGYTKGVTYGHCSLQLNANFKVEHNGLLAADGSLVPGVAQGMGGATYPVTNCPNKGSNLDVRCDTGFKPVQTHLTQMSCGANCFTYWVVYSCLKVEDSFEMGSIANIPDTPTNLPTNGSGSSSSSVQSSLKWVYTKVMPCVGPTPPPADIGAACSKQGQTATNSCGIATCQYQ